MTLDLIALFCFIGAALEFAIGLYTRSNFHFENGEGFFIIGAVLFFIGWILAII